MRKDIVEKISIPEGVELVITDGVIKLKKGDKEIERKFQGFTARKEGNEHAQLSHPNQHEPRSHPHPHQHKKTIKYVCAKKKQSIPTAGDARTYKSLSEHETMFELAFAW